MSKTTTRNLTKNRWKTNQKSSQNQSKIDQKSTKNPSKIHQNSIKIEKCDALRLGSHLGGLLEASWARLRGQHSPKLASQIEGKSIKNRCKNLSKKWCLSCCNFDAFLMDFWKENGGMLAPRSDQKSMPTSKGRFCKNYCKTNEFLMIFQSYGVEVGIKNQSKIH